ncbi:MAG: hypothetical protein JWN41_1289 [Thermoleophilia bacterium]|nr:hypothetical protein [Thermoleophilia bacterium]
MSVLVQTFIPGMTSAQYDATTEAIRTQLENFSGYLNFHSAAVVDGGLQITEAWATSDAYRMWIKDVVSTKVPAEAITAMQTKFTPLHNLIVADTVVSV